MTATAKSACPTDDELKDLLAESDPSARCEAMTGHVGECPSCQARMEALATGGDVRLSQCCRGADKLDPPTGSAFWKALDGAEDALTVTLDSNDTDEKPKPPEEIKLDFLRPAETPGRLGRLGHFEIVRVIGRGGMGVVLHAFDADLQRDVAVKLLDPQLAGNDTARARFCREARAAAAVTHENIVAVHQVDEDDASGLPYLVMQLVSGESLETRLSRGRLTVAEAVRIGSQAAAGLAAAHASGLIHRDIKPGNILLEAGSDKARLTDFGLARAAEDMKLTRTGFVAGTPLYMAPEQARGDEVDHRADLFALGSVLYESLAGKPPFGGKTPLQVLRRIADDRHEPLYRVNPEVPDWFADLIDRLLTKDAGKRIQSAAEVSAVLAEHLPCVESAEAAGECGPPECAPAKVMSKIVRRRVRSRTAVAMILGGSVAAGFAIGGVGGWFLGPKPEKIVEKEKLIQPTAAAAGSAAARDPGPAPAFHLPGEDGGVLALAVNDDGSRVLTGVEDGNIRIWDTAQPRVIHTLGGHTGPVWSLDFSDDERAALSAGDDSRVIFWNLTTRTAEKIPPHAGSVRAAAVHWKRKVFVTGDRAGQIRLWDMNEVREPVQLSMGASVTAAAFTPDGTAFATAGVNGKVKLWNVAESNDRDKERITLEGHKGPVYGVTFSADGKWVATAGWDKKVLVFNVNSGNRVKEITGFADGVTAVAFTPCCRYLAAGCMDGTITLYDLGAEDATQPVEVTRFARHRGQVTALKFTENGDLMVSGGRDGQVYGWKMAHSEPKGE
jgi:hypothetical protein